MRAPNKATYTEFGSVVSFLRQVGSAIRTLRPGAVRSMAREPVTFGVLAADDVCAEEIFECLYPSRSRVAREDVLRIASEADFARVGVGFSERGIPHPAHFHAFSRRDPRGSATALLNENELIWLPLARTFPGLRGMVSDRLIWKIAKENTLFTVATALPNIVPSVLALPWSVGEFSSDTAFLTINQVRLSLLLAAAHGHDPNYDAQGLKVGSIIGAAFGWRAAARGLVSKVPAGGGLIPKGLIAFAGTYVVGRSLEYWFREGRLLGKHDQANHYADAYRRGRETVERIVRDTLSTSRRVRGAAYALGPPGGLRIGRPMRVISGRFRRRKLAGLPGTATRPMLGRMRQRMFDILQGAVEGRVFADLYAGTGAVGIEALSRGARRAIFVESSRRAAQLIRRNLSAVGAGRLGVVRRAEVGKAIGKISADLYFLGPPYGAEREYSQTLRRLSNREAEWVIAQHDKRLELDEAYGSLTLVRVVRSGANQLSMYQHRS